MSIQRGPLTLKQIGSAIVGVVILILIGYMFSLPLLYVAGIIIIIGIPITQLQKRKQNKNLLSMLQSRERIRLYDLQQMLNMKDIEFNQKLYELAAKFNFKIDGEEIIINKDKISEFISALDEKFAEWEKSAQQRYKKI